MSQDSSSFRRVRLPAPRQQALQSQVSLVPDAPTLIDDALSVIATEIVKFKAKVGTGKSLDLGEARVLQGYIRSLVELCREQREREDSMDLASKTDAEIVALVEKLRSQKTEELPSRILEPAALPKEDSHES